MLLRVTFMFTLSYFFAIPGFLEFDADFGGRCERLLFCLFEIFNESFKHYGYIGVN